MNSSINRALIFQGGGSLGAYEAGAYKAIKEELSQYRRAKGRENGVIFLTMRTISSHLSVFLVDGIITSVLTATRTSLSADLLSAAGFYIGRDAGHYDYIVRCVCLYAIASSSSSLERRDRCDCLAKAYFFIEYAAIPARQPHKA